MRIHAHMRKMFFILALLTVLALATSAYAQTPTPNQIDEVARELWCPLCNGVRLDNCELQACIQMREVIAQKIEAGASTQEIKSYFVQQYGDVVLGQPSTQGFNLVAWIFPILAAAVGLAWVVYLVVTWRKKKQAVPVAVTDVSPEAASKLRGAPETDEYMKRVERELRETE